MCIEDVRLGRRTSPESRQFAVPDAGNTVIAPFDPFRVSILISVTSANGAFVAPQPLDPSTGDGLRISRTEVPILLDVQHHGNLVTQEWRASGDALAAVVTVLATYLPES